MGRTTTQNLQVRRTRVFFYRRRFRSILVVFLAIVLLCWTTHMALVGRNISLNWQSSPTREYDTRASTPSSPVTVQQMVLVSDTTHGHHHRELIELQVPDGDLRLFAGGLTYYGQWLARNPAATSTQGRRRSRQPRRQQKE